MLKVALPSQETAEPSRWRRWSRRPSLAAAAVSLVVVGLAVALTNPFAGSSPAANVGSNNGTISLQTVVRRSLSSQTQVAGTLGYADSSTVNLPGGTAPSDVRQAEQALAAARQSLASAHATLAVDSQILVQGQARLTADRLAEHSDCAGAAAAQSTSSGNGVNAGNAGNGGGSNGGGGGASPCASAAQAVASDETALQGAQQKVTADTSQVATAQTSVDGAAQNLVAAQASAVGYDAGAAYTMLPAAGAVIRRGQPLYGINGQPTLLLYGPVAAWRAFRPGMAPGRDVAELNRNLDALGYGHGLAGERFTAATEQAVRLLQAAHHMEETGVLALGAVAFASGPVRVTSVTPTLGQTVGGGSGAGGSGAGGSGAGGSAVLSVTSTRHVVVIQLSAAQQSSVNVGDRVVVTLPENSTTPGVVSKVGTVATVPSGNNSGSSSPNNGGSSSPNNGGSSSPTIEVDVRLLDQAAAGSLDQAPVSVAITTATVGNVLTVPVTALLALAGGGYAVEVVGAGGIHHLVAVTAGPVFDDADGLVQVSGSGLQAGQRVVVPSE